MWITQSTKNTIIKSVFRFCELKPKPNYWTANIELFKLFIAKNCTFGLFVYTNSYLTTKPWHLDIMKVMIDSIVLILILGVCIYCLLCRGDIFKESAPRSILSSSPDVCLCMFVSVLCSYVLPCHFFRPLIGPQIPW